MADLAAIPAPSRLLSRVTRGTRRLFTFVAAVAAIGLATPAAAAWREASTAHFLIYSEQNPKDLQEFATHLERFDKAMRFMRKLDDPDIGRANRVTVYVLSSETLVQKVYGAGSRRNGAEVAGFYIPRAGGSVAFVPRPAHTDGMFDLSAQTVLLHEYAHHFMLNNYPAAYPAWFVEGFAEFHSTASFEKDGSVGVGRAALHRAPQLLLDRPLPVEKLVAITQAKLGSDEGMAVYGRGWLLFHYLTMEKSRDGQLADYLTRINKGESSLEAARGAFGDLKQLDRELDRYLRKTLYYLRLPGDKLGTTAVSIRELRAAENAMMPLKIRSTRGVDPEQAKPLVLAMREAAADYPNDPAAQNVLAEGEFDAGNYAEAEAAADRALAADPKSVHALIYKARAQMMKARAAHDRSETRWHGIRAVLGAANRVDTEDPRPLIFFYRSYLAQGVKPPAIAAAGLTKALDLAPQDTGLRMNVAHQLLVDGKAKEARAVLGPVAFDPHGGKARDVASRAIAAIDSGGPAAALQEWKKAVAGDEGDEGDDKGEDE